MPPTEICPLRPPAGHLCARGTDVVLFEINPFNSVVHLERFGQCLRGSEEDLGGRSSGDLGTKKTKENTRKKWEGSIWLRRKGL